MKLSKEYIAGFIDGEAYIGLIRKTNKECKLGFTYKPNIKVTQRSKFGNVLKELQNEYGGYITTKELSTSSNQCSIDVWEIANRPMVKKVLEDIRPFTLVKKNHVKYLLGFIDLPKSGSLIGKLHDDKKAEIYLKLRTINKRGLAETNRSGDVAITSM